MGRTVIHEEQSTPTGYVEERSGSGLGIALGILLGVLFVVLAVMLLRGTWNDDINPSPGTGNNDDTVPSAPAQPGEPSVLPT